MPGLRNQSKTFIYLLAFLSASGYVFITYFLERHETPALLSAYFIVFSCYLAILWKEGVFIKQETLDLKTFIYLAIILRLCLFFALPNLSDDFYRFIWDGRLLATGINPFAQLPTFYIEGSAESVPGITEELFRNLNSPEYFTIYPPINQLIFWISAIIPGQSIFVAVLVMRFFILAAELGTIWLLPKVLQQFNLPRNASLIYTLNPLVIIEVTGNLHFEGMMVFFILLSLWWLNKEKLALSASALAFAVGTKLIPLIFLPFLPRPLSLKKISIYYSVCGLTILLLFLPLLSSELINGLQSSLSLYYQKFEFNASIYFILREFGFWEFGYNRIEFIGKDLINYTFWSIMILAFWQWGKRPILPTLFMFALGIYLLFSTTVHPWYVITLLALSVFTNYRSPLLWTLVIFLTYSGYTISGFQLPTWVLYLEYGSVLAFFIFELSRELGIIKLIRSKANG